MSKQDPTEPIWRTVAELELQHYTKSEIAEALREVAEKTDPDDGKMGK